VYWWISSYSVKRAVRQESALSRAAHFVPLGLAGVLLTVRSVPGWLGKRWIAPSSVVSIVGVTLVAVGLLFSVWSRITLGGNWSGSVTIKQNHEIVRTGPYRWIRHPIYTGLVLAFLGSAVARGEWRGVLADHDELCRALSVAPESNRSGLGVSAAGGSRGTGVGNGTVGWWAGTLGGGGDGSGVGGGPATSDGLLSA
jgi:hypothetical protein